MSYSIIASIDKNPYTTKITLGDFQLIADEPKQLGGADKGPSPGALLRASLASCVAITLKMYVDRKGWDVGQIDVEIVDHLLDSGQIKMIKKISVEKEINEDQRKRLAIIADKCPVSKVLKSGIDQATTVE